MWTLNIEMYLPVEDIYDYRLKITITKETFPSGTNTTFVRYEGRRDPVSIVPWTRLGGGWSGDHGLSTGDQITVTNSTNIEDLPNGTYTVTVEDDDYFKVYVPRVYPYADRPLTDQRGVCDWVKVGFDAPTEYDTAKIFLWQKDDTKPVSAPVDVEYFTNVCSVADLTLRPEDTAAAPEDTLYRKDYLDMVFRSRDVMLECLGILEKDIAELRDAIIAVVTTEEDGDHVIPSGTPWTPAYMTTHAWYDAADIDTIVGVAGGVAQWDDKSGNDYHLVNGGGSAQPETGAREINRLNALDFAGNIAPQYMENTDPAMSSIFDGSPSEFDIYIVYQNDDPENVGMWLANMYGPAGSPSARGTLSSDPAYIGYLKEAYAQGFDYVQVVETAIRDSASHIFNISGDDTNMYLYQDGNLLGSEVTSALNVIGMNTFRLGTDRNNNKSMDGAVAELIVLDSKADQATREIIEGYLAWKWGFENNLPSGHLYKDAKPLWPI